MTYISVDEIETVFKKKIESYEAPPFTFSLDTENKVKKKHFKKLP